MMMMMLVSPTVISAIQPKTAAAAAPAPAPAPSPSPAPVAAGDDVEEELQELVSEMVKLKLGLKKGCITFARSLAVSGVTSLEDLRLLPLDKARAILEKSAMLEIQIEKIVAAFKSPQETPSPAPIASQVAAPAPHEQLYHTNTHLVPPHPPRRNLISTRVSACMPASDTPTLPRAGGWRWT